LNRSGLLFLIIAIILTVAMTWLNSSWVNYKYFQLTKKEKKIDYYLSNFTLLNTQEDGQMRYLITGKYLIHQQKTGASEIFNPVLEAQNTDGTITSIIAQKAQQMKKNGDIELEGDVIVDKEANNKSSNGYNIKTSDLTYNPVERKIHSKAKLAFKSINVSLQGTGFSSKLDEQEFRIHSNVQANYQPQK